MSVNSISPQTLFGGTWTQIKDRFLLACGDTYTNGTTGGEATHKLTVNEMPSHNHSNYVTNGWGSKDWGYNFSYTNTAALNNGASGFEGGNQPHNNMPPYLAVYIWKRTA